MACVTQPKVVTGWSRHDPVMAPRGNSDHWAKMRMRGPYTGPDPASEPFPVKEKKSSKRASLSASALSPSASQGDGRVDPVANAVASRVPVYDFHGNVPGNYAAPHYAVYTSNPDERKPVSARSVKYGNQYQDRAKQGFEFWYRERPKPTRFGRYGIGSYKTLLGLGNAPRT